MSSDLKPCPFCGLGDTRIDVTTHWTGMRSIPLRYEIKHWCQYGGDGEGGFVVVRAQTEDRARHLWNQRAGDPP